MSCFWRLFLISAVLGMIVLATAVFPMLLALYLMLALIFVL